MAALLIRDALIDDLPAITDIYAREVAQGLASFEEQPPDLAEMTRRFDRLAQGGFPYLVAMQEKKLLGYAYAGPYRARPAYRHTIENSVYVMVDAQGQGVGRRLLQSLITKSGLGPWRQMVAVIGNSENTASIALHLACGFEQVGTLRAVGFKHGQWVDTVLMQRSL